MIGILEKGACMKRLIRKKIDTMKEGIEREGKMKFFIKMGLRLALVFALKTLVMG